MNTLGTSVKNPVHRQGASGFVPCCYCNKLFTKLGVSRHWDHCKMNPINSFDTMLHNQIMNVADCHALGKGLGTIANLAHVVAPYNGSRIFKLMMKYIHHPSPDGAYNYKALLIAFFLSMNIDEIKGIVMDYVLNTKDNYD